MFYTWQYLGTGSSLDLGWCLSLSEFLCKCMHCAMTYLRFHLACPDVEIDLYEIDLFPGLVICAYTCIFFLLHQ